MLNKNKKTQQSKSFAAEQVAFWFGMSLCVVIGILSLSLFAPAAHAATAIRPTINWQGKITSDAGLNVSVGDPACVAAGADSCGFRMTIYDASSGGNQQWTEDHTSVEIGDYDGVFHLELGSVTTFASAGLDFTSDELWLEVIFDYDGNGFASTTETFSDRQRIQAVPQAFTARTLTAANDSYFTLLPGSDGAGDTDDTGLFNNSSNDTIELRQDNTARLLLGLGTDDAHFNLPSRTGPGSATEGDLWYNGTNLWFQDSTNTVDLLSSGLTSMTVGSMSGTTLFADNTADDDWLGLGSGAGRIAFDDQTTDEVTILDANVGIGIADPATKLHLDTGTLQIGSANTVTISQNSTAAERSGTARRTYRTSLVPEFPGAVFTADGAANAGTMTSDFDTSNFHNYYDWTTTEASAQDYDIYVRYQLPSDFDGWVSSNPIYAYGWRTDSTTNAVEISLYDTTNTQQVSSVNVATGTAAWTETTLGASITGTYSAGDYITYKIHVIADTNDHVRVGEIRMDYFSKWK